MNIYFLKLSRLFFLIVICFSGDLIQASQSRQIFCDSKLSHKLFPVKDKNGAYEVGVGIVPLNITKFNLKESSAEVDFYLTIEYRLQERVTDVKCVGEDAQSVWRIFYNPDIEFMNIPNPEYMQGWHWLISGNRFIYMTRAKGTVAIDGDFRRFPFDSTKISFTASGEDNIKVMRLHPSEWYHPSAEALQKQMDGVKIPGWQLNGAAFSQKLDVAEDGTGTWDLLSLELDLARKSSTIVIRSGVPLLFLYLVAFFSLRLPEKFLDVRVGTQAAVLLALFAYSVYFIESIPATDYLTFGDWTWITILTAIFLIIGSEALGHSANVRAWELSLKRMLPRISFLMMVALTVVGVYLYFLT